MKKWLSLVLSIILLLTPATISAEEIVLSGTLTHTHVGTSGTGTPNGCYTKAYTTTSSYVYNNCCASCKEGPLAHYEGNPYGACGSFNPNWVSYNTTYILDCSLTSCDYVITKEDASGGVQYTIQLGQSNFLSTCHYEYFDEESDTPIYSADGTSCLLSSDYSNGYLKITLKDIKGNTYTLENIAIENVKLIIIRDNETLEIKKIYFNDVEIKSIFYDSEKVF